MEDIEEKMDNTAVENAKSFYGYGTPNGPYSASNSWYPNIYANEVNSKIGDGPRRTDGLKLSEQTSFIEGDVQKTQGTGLSPIRTYYYLSTSDFTTALGENSSIIPNGSSMGYWVASRCVGRGYSNCDFHVRNVSGGGLNLGTVFNSADYTNYGSEPVLPVVSLSSELLVPGTTTKWKVN